MKVNYQTTIGTESWRAEFTLAEKNLMSFYLGECNIFNLAPVLINKQSEAQSLPKKNRIHQKIDGLSLSQNISNLIPFGAEPKIDREFDFADGFARIIQDINPGKSTAAEKLTVDRMSLPGPWKRLAVVKIPGKGKSFTELDWIELDGDSEKVFFEESYPFLAVILESDDGKCLEIGTGDDLWRWGISADLPGCTADFSIKGNKETVEIVRTPVIFETEEGSPEIERRTWRFKWYFAWSESLTIKKTSDKKRLELDMTDFIEDGAKIPCMHAASSRKKIRQVLRGLFANNENTEIVLKNAGIHVCNQKSHLDRSTKKSFLHWDAWDLMELFIWANRKALAGENSFSIETGIDTPLGNRLSRSDFQHISGE
jgi:hypothetical protein